VGEELLDIRIFPFIGLRRTFDYKRPEIPVEGHAADAQGVWYGASQYPSAIVQRSRQIDLLGVSELLRSSTRLSRVHAATPVHIRCGVRFCFPSGSEFRCEAGVPRGLVPINVQPAGHVRQQLGQLHGVPGAAAATCLLERVRAPFVRV
jgi:hypothetical protein